MNYLSIDIGGTFIKYALMNDEARLLEKDKVPTPRDTEEHFFSVMKDICDPYLDRIGGIAISATGIVDLTTGFVKDCALGDIMDLDLFAGMRKFTGDMPLAIENDAKSAALAELWKGGAKDGDSAVLIVIGTAIGGAIIVDRKVIRGAHQLAGELSFFIGNNEKEPAVSSWAAEELGIPGLIRFVSAECGISSENLTGEKIFAMAEAGEEKVMECLRIYAHKLAILCINMEFTVDPDVILIGGGVSEQPLLLQLVREEADRIMEASFIPLPGPVIDVCRFNNEANLIGALYVLLIKEGKIR